MTDREERNAPEPGVAGSETLSGAAGESLGDVRSAPSPAVEHSADYLRTLLLLLLAATFFEGYDGSILALVLPAIQKTFAVTESQLGVSRAIIELGLGGAFFLARAGDRWGRRKLLLWSVLGYTLMTALTAVSTDLWMFTAFQSVSRVFLGAEYAVAVTMIVEEFPKERRARTLGLFLMCSAVGAIVVVLLALAGLDSTSLGWRGLYLVGVIPLIFLAFFRRGLKETQRFQRHADDAASSGRSLRVNFFEPWRAPYRRTLVMVGLIHLFRSLPLFGATAWYFYYAQGEGGLTDTASQLIFLVAYGAGTAGYWVCGRAMDRYGRRPTAIVYGLMAAVSASALFQARTPLAIGVLLVLAVFFGLGMAPVTGAISTELFPTYIRNQSAAWARNIFEIAGFILGPLLVGVLGDHYSGALGSIGDTVTILVMLFVPATWLIWRHLPETMGRELEEIEDDLGVAHIEQAAPVRQSWRPWAVFASTIIVLLVGGAFGVRALGDITRRPEGAAERFLNGIDDGNEEQIARYGHPAIAAAIFRNGDVEFEKLDVYPAKHVGSLDYVPFKAVLSKPRHVTVSATLLVAPQGRGHPQERKVVTFSPNRFRVEGSGPPPAPRAAWFLAAIAILLLTIAAEVTLRSMRYARS
jgi:MFS transporter, putative metabolite:H+ symporter